MPRHPPNRTAAALAALTVLTAGGCGTDNPAGPSAEYAGAWTGSTSQGRPFHFYVSDQGIVLAVFGFQVVGTNCTVGLVMFRAREAPDAPFAITGDAFSIQTSWSGGSPGSGTVNLAGSFASATTASGTIAADATTCGGTISETWTATKATGPEVSFAGTWAGTFSSNLTSSDITFTLNQSGSALSGSFAGPNGLAGTISGTVSGKFAAVRLNETTQGCPGRFDGHAVVFDVAPALFIYFAVGGSNCLGTHRNAGGFADPL